MYIKSENDITNITIINNEFYSLKGIKGGFFFQFNKFIN